MKKKSLFFPLILICLSTHPAFAAHPLTVPPSGLTATASQSSATSSRWTLVGTERYTLWANEWLEYLLDFGSGGSWIFSLTATNQRAPLPPGYAFKIRVAVDGITKGHISVDGSATTYKTGSFTPLTLSGVHTIRFAWTNDAYKQGAYDANIRVKNVSFKPKAGDTAPPTGTISINSGAAYTNTLSVRLSLSATDNSGRVSQMQFSNDNTSWSAPEAYATSRAWVLAQGDGPKTVWVKYKDVSGNWSSASSDTITLDTLAPQITSITPIDGSRFYEDETVRIFPQVSDHDPSPLEYQFSLDSIIKQPWSRLSNYSLQPQPGRHTFKLELKDIGGTDSKQGELYIFRRPISPPD